MDEHLRINEQEDDVWTCHLLPSNVRTIEATITIRDLWSPGLHSPVRIGRIYALRRKYTPTVTLT